MALSMTSPLSSFDEDLPAAHVTRSIASVPA
jgi:hypothetical protein